MTNEEAISNLKKLRSYHNGSYGTAIDMAIKALEQISHLIDRPCGSCEYYLNEGRLNEGCNKWFCVFDEVKGIRG